jgi:hypothetical protein
MPRKPTRPRWDAASQSHRRDTSSPPWWPGMGESSAGTPWGRCVDAFDAVMEHARVTPGASILLAAGTAAGFVNMHSACEYYLPQAGANRISGVWFFPGNSRLRVARIADMEDLASISSRRFSLVAAVVESEAIVLLEPLLTPDGRIIPFLGRR